MNKAGEPFVVYTPFRRACEAIELSRPLPAVTRLTAHDLPQRPLATLARLGFEEPAAERWPGGATAARRRLARFIAHGLERYAAARDFPAVPAISRLSADLRFGTLSPRTVAWAALETAGGRRSLRPSVEKFVSELRWRDFYAHVLWHFPHCETGAFRREYDDLRWEGERAHVERWQQGHTGYPIVDAGMRELLATGFMHNRVRMIVASFLTKDLLLDWRLGERHFMRHLVDGDLASNNGGWQWAAGTGTDAQPYFRIFNPVLQGRRFDPEGAYVKRWVPELAQVPAGHLHAPWEAPPLELAAAGVTLGKDYPAPIVDHAVQRERALDMYKVDAATRARTVDRPAPRRWPRPRDS
jgi:deoxyribodipyrimidine photo-lyase